VIAKMKPIKRGDIFYARLNPVVGSEQGETRPVLVVQNNLGNKYSPTIVIVPITGKLKKNSLPTHVNVPKDVGLEFDSLALVEQIRTIDRIRICEYIGRIGNKVQSDIDAALAVCVGIEKKFLDVCELLVKSLCSRCEAKFRDSNYVVVKKEQPLNKETCDFCKQRKGLVFGVYKFED
jgi:mRNA interferase MazF